MHLHDEKVNLRVAYGLAFLSELYFPISAWIFFFLLHLDFKQIAILTAFGGLANILLEVPTGAFADLVGRKKAIILSYVLFSVSMFAMPFASSYTSFFILMFLMSLTNALISGSLESLVYDTLKERGQEGRFDKVVSRAVALAWVGLFLGSVSGGWLYTQGVALPYVAQGIAAAIGVALAFLLYEPKIDSVRYSFRNFLFQNTQGFRELFQNLQVAQKTIIFTIIGAGYFTAASILGISQAREYGLNAAGVGILFGCGYLLSAAASHVYPTLRKMLGTKNLVFFTAVAVVSSFLFAQYVGMYVGLALIVIRIASSTIFTNSSSVIFNTLLSSKNRATALSSLALLNKIPYTVGAYFIGEYLNKASPNMLALKIGIIMLVLLGAQWIVFSVGKKRFMMRSA